MGIHNDLIQAIIQLVIGVFVMGFIAQKWNNGRLRTWKKPVRLVVYILFWITAVFTVLTVIWIAILSPGNTM